MLALPAAPAPTAAPARPRRDAPMTAAELAAADEIERAYREFFNFLPFKRGWKQPPFSPRAAAPNFRRAARIVSLVRSRELPPGFSLRAVDGAARDWMHGAGGAPAVDGLVHESFKDANGYTDGLDAAAVDRYVAAYAALADESDDDGPPPAAEPVDARTSGARSRLRRTGR